MKSQFDLTRFYDLTIRNSVFQLGNCRSYQDILDLKKYFFLFIFEAKEVDT